ncbi:hypothetical protein GTO89_14845 [Heliobacterium gestii]|uniref:Uncharacterized protein n=1 Tax=Heliomicrobium gestii TaxID=2699 RepID=A0A845LH32_HELGE|nr:hypothetical protein [Heliomicrobium gestii]MBM7868044.1 hypothetical protein [Heliomicrobium gestii]MZP44310.1 hypothetical protein [Heliomicrobium gestii]
MQIGRKTKSVSAVKIGVIGAGGERSLALPAPLSKKAATATSFTEGILKKYRFSHPFGFSPLTLVFANLAAGGCDWGSIAFYLKVVLQEARSARQVISKGVPTPISITSGVPDGIRKGAAASTVQTVLIRELSRFSNQRALFGLNEVLRLFWRSGFDWNVKEQQPYVPKSRSDVNGRLIVQRLKNQEQLFGEKSALHLQKPGERLGYPSERETFVMTGGVNQPMALLRKLFSISRGNIDERIPNLRGVRQRQRDGAENSPYLEKLRARFAQQTITNGFMMRFRSKQRITPLMILEASRHEVDSKARVIANAYYTYTALEMIPFTRLTHTVSHRTFTPQISARLNTDGISEIRLERILPLQRSGFGSVLESVIRHVRLSRTLKSIPVPSSMPKGRPKQHRATLTYEFYKSQGNVDEWRLGRKAVNQEQSIGEKSAYTEKPRGRFDHPSIANILERANRSKRRMTPLMILEPPRAYTPQIILRLNTANITEFESKIMGLSQKSVFGRILECAFRQVLLRRTQKFRRFASEMPDGILQQKGAAIPHALLDWEVSAGLRLSWRVCLDRDKRDQRQLSSKIRGNIERRSLGRRGISQEQSLGAEKASYPEKRRPRLDWQSIKNSFELIVSSNQQLTPLMISESSHNRFDLNSRVVTYAYYAYAAMGRARERIGFPGTTQSIGCKSLRPQISVRPNTDGVMEVRSGIILSRQRGFSERVLESSFRQDLLTMTLKSVPVTSPLPEGFLKQNWATIAHSLLALLEREIAGGSQQRALFGFIGTKLVGKGHFNSTSAESLWPVTTHNRHFHRDVYEGLRLSWRVNFHRDLKVQRTLFSKRRSNVDERILSSGTVNQKRRVEEESAAYLEKLRARLDWQSIRNGFELIDRANQRIAPSMILESSHNKFDLNSQVITCANYAYAALWRARGRIGFPGTMGCKAFVSGRVLESSFRQVLLTGTLKSMPETSKVPEGFLKQNWATIAHSLLALLEWDIAGGKRQRSLFGFIGTKPVGKGCFESTSAGSLWPVTTHNRHFHRDVYEGLRLSWRVNFHWDQKEQRTLFSKSRVKIDERILGRRDVVEEQRVGEKRAAYLEKNWRRFDCQYAALRRAKERIDFPGSTQPLGYRVDTPQISAPSHPDGVAEFGWEMRRPVQKSDLERILKGVFHQVLLRRTLTSMPVASDMPGGKRKQKGAPSAPAVLDWEESGVFQHRALFGLKGKKPVGKRILEWTSTVSLWPATPHIRHFYRDLLVYEGLRLSWRVHIDGDQKEQPMRISKKRGNFEERRLGRRTENQEQPVGADGSAYLAELQAYAALGRVRERTRFPGLTQSLGYKVDTLRISDVSNPDGVAEFGSEMRRPAQKSDFERILESVFRQALLRRTLRSMPVASDMPDGIVNQKGAPVAHTILEGELTGGSQRRALFGLKGTKPFGKGILGSMSTVSLWPTTTHIRHFYRDLLVYGLRLSWRVHFERKQKEQPMLLSKSRNNVDQRLQNHRDVNQEQRVGEESAVNLETRRGRIVDLFLRKTFEEASRSSQRKGPLAIMEPGPNKLNLNSPMVVFSFLGYAALRRAREMSGSPGSMQSLWLRTFTPQLTLKKQLKYNRENGGNPLRLAWRTDIHRNIKERSTHTSQCLGKVNKSRHPSERTPFVMTDGLNRQAPLLLLPLMRKRENVNSPVGICTLQTGDALRLADAIETLPGLFPILSRKYHTELTRFHLSTCHVADFGLERALPLQRHIFRRMSASVFQRQQERFPIRQKDTHDQPVHEKSVVQGKRTTAQSPGRIEKGREQRKRQSDSPPLLISHQHIQRLRRWTKLDQVWNKSGFNLRTFIASLTPDDIQQTMKATQMRPGVSLSSWRSLFMSHLTWNLHRQRGAEAALKSVVPEGPRQKSDVGSVVGKPPGLSAYRALPTVIHFSQKKAEETAIQKLTGIPQTASQRDFVRFSSKRERPFSRMKRDSNDPIQEKSKDAHSPRGSLMIRLGPLPVRSDFRNAAVPDAPPLDLRYRQTPQQQAATDPHANRGDREVITEEKVVQLSSATRSGEKPLDIQRITEVVYKEIQKRWSFERQRRGL